MVKITNETNIFLLERIFEDPRFSGLSFGVREENVFPSLLGRDQLEDDLIPIHELESGLPIESLAAKWKPVKVLGQVSPFNDYPKIDYYPCFSKRACEALSDLLDGNGELLPVETENGVYYIYHVTKVIDILDLNKSDITFKHSHPRIALEVDHFVLSDGLDIDAAIFKIPQLVYSVFVTDTFYQRVMESNLNGFRFYRAHPAKRGEKWRKPFNPGGAEEAKKVLAKEAALSANTIVLMFETKADDLSLAEEKRMDKIIALLNDGILRVDSLDDAKYLGKVEMYDVVDKKLRLYISCPDSKKLAGILDPWRINLKWWPVRPEMIVGDFDFREAPNHIIPKIFHDE